MFGKPFVKDLIERSAENERDRRVFLRNAGLAGLGVVGASVAGGSLLNAAAAEEPVPEVSDSAVLNFALNLEYLEAEFYSVASTGHGLSSDMIDGRGTLGPVTGGRKVTFSSNEGRQYAREIAGDEVAHVAFLRAALGSARVARPAIDLQSSFTAAARAAGIVGPNQTFDPFASENNFFLAAFIFEDVGVTAYKGASPLIRNKTYLEAAAGILAVEAYHAATVRTLLWSRGLKGEANGISAARNALDGPADDDQGIYTDAGINITPTDSNAIAYSRSADRVLNVVYLTPNSSRSGGFFPAGVNGSINTSGGGSG